MNMHKWLEDVKASPVKKPFPILTFPCVRLMDITVKELISDSDNQAKGMKAIADRVDSLAAVSYMDLSLEAEAFGADIKVTEDEVPTVIGTLVPDEEAAEALQIPGLEAGRIRRRWYGLRIRSGHIRAADFPEPFAARDPWNDPVSSGCRPAPSVPFSEWRRAFLDCLSNSSPGIVCIGKEKPCMAFFRFSRIE